MTVWQVSRPTLAAGQISLVCIFRVENDKVAEIQAFYDPRGFSERLGE
jgi:hypothetical protein